MPAVSFIPYFPDEEVNITVGQYRLWNWWQHRDSQVIDENIRLFLNRYFGLFRRANGKLETRIAILSPLTGDAFPDHQDLEEVSRITNSLMAAYLFNLPTVDRGWGFCSSDNFTGMYQRFSPTQQEVPTISFSFGNYFKTTVGGSWEHLHFTTPQFVPNVFGCAPVEELLNELASLCSDTTEPVVRLFRSLEWLKLTFMNYEGFQHEARPVAMCTGFEALLDFPESGKARYFSDRVNKLLPSNRMTQSTRQLGTKVISDTPVGWWCRDFYDLRSRIVHGERVNAADWRNSLGAEQLRLALYLFEECIWGLLVEWGRIPSDQRVMEFIMRSNWRDGLGVNMSDFI
jgi:hypothetical protein